MKIFKYLLPSICILSTCLSASEHTPRPHSHHAKPISHIKKGNAKFSFDLYNTMREETENLLISPYSISSSLALAMMGAEGPAHHQMCKVLHLPHGKVKVDMGFLHLNHQLITQMAAEEEPVHIRIANGLFAQKGMHLHHEYMNKRRHFWMNGIQQVDFKADAEESRQQINTWVHDETLGLIGDLMPEGTINQDTRMVLVNALYLKAPWKNGFAPELTYRDQFHGMRENVQEIDYMNQTERLDISPMDGYRVLEIPFKEALSNKARLALFVVLPDMDQTLSQVEEKIDFPHTIKHWIELHENKRVNLHFPKFDMTYSKSLKTPLIALGMDKPFCGGFPWPNEEADQLVLTDVVHKTTISFDEGGVLASAATGSTMGITSYEEPVDFVMNKPFMYMIVDKTTHTILFMGRVANLD